MDNRMNSFENNSSRYIGNDLIRFLGNDVLSAAPEKEPERQHYFIAQLKALGNPGASDAQDQSHDADMKPLTAAVVTFGCQMNARDSEKLTGILEEARYEMTDDEENADFVIFNTCTVRENANEHLYGRLGRLKNMKKSHPERIIAVCGCMMQESDEVAKLRQKYAYVDLIFGTHNLYKFPELLFMLHRKRLGMVDSLEAVHAGNAVLTDSSADHERYEKLLRYGGNAGTQKDLEKLYRKPVVSVWQDSGDIVEDLPQQRKFPFKQGINIMFGCNNFCSYCIVPYVRGREKSRTPGEILEEIRRAAGEGVKEIMLLGQNVNSYRGISSEESVFMSFPELLQKVDDLAEETGIERIRFMTSHPKDLSDELIEVMAKSKHVCHQFHLPLQSGSSRILKRMNRHYDKERFLDRAAHLREAMPDIVITTDIIVGFPGESEEDFLETLDVVEKVRFDAAFTFIYSKREGTPAASFDDQVDEADVKDRFDRLLELQNRIAAESLERFRGETLPVLFEDVSEYDPMMITGKLENGTTVHVAAEPEDQQRLIGTVRQVRLEESHGFYYTGSLV